MSRIETATQSVCIGLTGGIGSGKSTVAGLLSKVGALVIDADAASRSVTGPKGVALTGIVREFGPEFISAQGALDRDKMRALVFSNPWARERLEALLHPLIEDHIRRQAQAALGEVIVFDIPLLAQSIHWRQRMDVVWVTDCATETQIRRVMLRNGWEQQEVEKILASQLPRAQQASTADAVIFNDDLSLEALSSQVMALLGQTRAQFGL